jgi:spore germination protein GerM
VRNSRGFALLALLVLVAVATVYYRRHNASPIHDRITVYYTKIDGKTLAAWPVSMRPQEPGEGAAEHLHNAVVYAATQAVAGPPSDVPAIRFPVGTHVLDANVTGTTASVDLSPEVDKQTGSFGEGGEFKALVWTLTALPGIDAVAVRVNGETVDALPGGHLELDQPLHRSDF